jgi:hypothetical protein
MHACEAMIELLFVEIWLPAADGFVVETVLRASTQRTMSVSYRIRRFRRIQNRKPSGSTADRRPIALNNLLIPVEARLFDAP